MLQLLMNRVPWTTRLLLGGVLISAAASGCGGSSATPDTAGPIVILTTLGSDLSPRSTPLPVGQTLAVSFFEQRCRYQQYTSEKAAGQYKTLGCDAPTYPARLVVTIYPIASTGQPCGMSAQNQSNVVFFTKTGQGDPGLGGAPPYFCSATVTDPTLHGSPADTQRGVML